MYLVLSLLAAVTKSTTTAAFPVNPGSLSLETWKPISYGGETLDFHSREVDPQNLRTVSEIVWSCLATVFACSWVSVHPNIPSPDDSDFAILRRRIGLMFWGVIAPELLIIWAMRQWLHARKIERKYKSRGWTKVHGHFLVMGGFMLYQNGGPIQTLSIERFTELLQAKSIDFPIISRKEILDRSKGDLFSKTVIMIQVAWFAVQCMARRAQGLAITELELVTLAFTTLNGAMYFCWWDKPLDVQSTFRIELKPGNVAEEEKIPIADQHRVEELEPEQQEHTPQKDPLQATEHKYEAVDVEDEASTHSTTPQSARNQRDEIPLKTRIWNKFVKTMASVLNSIMQPLREVVAYIQKEGVIGSFYNIFIHWPIKNILYGFGNIVESDTSGRVMSGALRVPMFYAPPIGLDAVDISRFTASLLGIVFGSIHLAAWSGEFPTAGAKTLWRVASLIITLLPAIIFLTKVLSRFFERLGDPWEDCFDGPLFVVEFLTGAGGILVYVPSRVALFTIAFLCLKSIPPDGFQKVVWTSFIPHIA